MSVTSGAATGADLSTRQVALDRPRPGGVGSARRGVRLVVPALLRPGRRSRTGRGGPDRRGQHPADLDRAGLPARPPRSGRSWPGSDALRLRPGDARTTNCSRMLTGQLGSRRSTTSAGWSTPPECRSRECSTICSPGHPRRPSECRSGPSSRPGPMVPAGPAGVGADGDNGVPAHRPAGSDRELVLPMQRDRTGVWTSLALPHWLGATYAYDVTVYVPCRPARCRRPR